METLKLLAFFIGWVIQFIIVWRVYPYFMSWSDMIHTSPAKFLYMRFVMSVFAVPVYLAIQFG